MQFTSEPLRKNWEPFRRTFRETFRILPESPARMHTTQKEAQIQIHTWDVSHIMMLKSSSLRMRHPVIAAHEGYMQIRTYIGISLYVPTPTWATAGFLHIVFRNPSGNLPEYFRRISYRKRKNSRTDFLAQGSVVPLIRSEHLQMPPQLVQYLIHKRFLRQ